jgi:hypothetical protein
MVLACAYVHTRSSGFQAQQSQSCKYYDTTQCRASNMRPSGLPELLYTLYTRVAALQRTTAGEAEGQLITPALLKLRWLVLLEWRLLEAALCPVA